MKNAMVIYESSYGNTHIIAEAIADGLRKNYAVKVLSVASAMSAAIAGVDLIVVGGPTHVHGLSRPQTRRAAVGAIGKPGVTLTLDENASTSGLREWLETVSAAGTPAAAFDTRVDAPALVTGRASKEIGRHLEHNGFKLVTEPMSFLVTKATELLPGQREAAHRWGEILAGMVA